MPVLSTVAQTELHVWRAELDSNTWPSARELPADEQLRAERMLDKKTRPRWVAARWALRSVLARYLGGDPAAIELNLGEHGKPHLAAPGATLRFNLSHSGEAALIAVAEGREVGIDVQRIGSRRPPSYYREWTRREAVVKCHGVGLWAELPGDPVAVAELDAGPGYAAAVAAAGLELPRLRQFVAEPA